MITVIVKIIIAESEEQIPAINPRTNSFFIIPPKKTLCLTIFDYRLIVKKNKAN